jgi:4-carboxymuconolactone decarboxylase
LITVGALTTLRCPTELRSQLRIALHHGLSRRELCEAMLQVGGYAGLAVGLEGMRILADVFAGAGPEDAGGSEPALPPEYEDGQDRLARGRAVLEKLRPDIPQSAPGVAGPQSFAPDWGTWLVETAFGELWSRPGLTLQERERVTLAVLIVLSHDQELSAHFKISANVGIPLVEIGETIMHLAVYAGFPTAVKAIRIASEAFAELAEATDE